MQGAPFASRPGRLPDVAPLVVALVAVAAVAVASLLLRAWNEAE